MLRRSTLPLVCSLLSSCSLIPAEYDYLPTTNTGALTYSVQSRKDGDTPRELRNQVTGTINANSYVWQPWLVTTSGTLNLTGEVVSGGDPSAADASVVTGSVAASLLPRSNFPATLSYSRTDSQVDGTLLATNQKTQRATFLQNLFLTDLNAQAELTHEDIDNSDFGTGRTRTANMDVEKRFGSTTLGLGLRHDENRFVTIGSGVIDDRNDVATFRQAHNMELLGDLRSQSTASFIDSESRAFNFTRRIQSLQGVTTTQWRPTDAPFTVNGALRTLTQNVELTGATSLDSQRTLASGIIGMNYPLAERLSANLGLTSTFEQQEFGGSEFEDSISSETSFTAGALAGLNYYSLPMEFGGFEYSWNAGTVVQQLFGSGDAAGPSGSVTFGHEVRRLLDFPFAGEVVASLSQTGTMVYESTGEFVPGIGHTLALTKTASDDRSQTYIRLAATDTRDFDPEFPSSFQLFTAQLNRTTSIDLSRNWQAALTVQAGRQSLAGLDSGLITSANGFAGYFERNVFGLENLSFRSDLTLGAIGLGAELETAPFENRLFTQWGNRLDYRIGMLLLSAEARLYRKDGKYGDLFLLQVRRYFN